MQALAFPKVAKTRRFVFPAFHFFLTLQKLCFAFKHAGICTVLCFVHLCSQKDWYLQFYVFALFLRKTRNHNCNLQHFVPLEHPKNAVAFWRARDQNARLPKRTPLRHTETACQRRMDCAFGLQLVVPNVKLAPRRLGSEHLGRVSGLLRLASCSCSLCSVPSSLTRSPWCREGSVDFFPVIVIIGGTGIFDYSCVNRGSWNFWAFKYDAGNHTAVIISPWWYSNDIPTLSTSHSDTGDCPLVN